MERLKFFDKETIEWPEEMLLHDFYKTLLLLKRRNPALSNGDSNVKTDFIKTNHEQSVIAWRRTLLEKEVIVILNLSSHEPEVKIKDENVRGSYLDVFDETALDLSTEITIRMGPWESLVLEK